MIPFNKLCVSTLSIDVASVSANTTAEQTFTLPGINTNDVILSITKPSSSTGLGIVGWRISANNTVAITYMNATGSGIDPAAETYTIVILRPEHTIANAARFNSM